MLKNVLRFVAILIYFCSLEVVGQPAFTSLSANAHDSLKVKEDFYSALKEKISGTADQSELYFKRVLEADPQNDAAFYELGGLYNAQNRNLLAKEYVKKAVALNADNKWYWLLLAEVYKKENKLNDLIPVFDELIRLEPELEATYFDKANAWYLLGRIEDAEAVIKEIESRFGDSRDLAGLRQRVALKQKDPTDEIIRLENIVKEDPGDIQAQLSLSELYIKVGRSEKAITQLKKIRKTDPENAIVQLMLADAYRSAGKDTQAFGELQQAFLSDRLAIDVKIQILFSYFGKIKESAVAARAEKLSNLIVQAHSTDPKSYTVKGDLLFQLERLDEAGDSYKSALSLNKNSYLVWEQLLQTEIALQKFDDAVKDGEEAISLYPEQPILYFFTGIAYEQKEQHEKAASYLRKAGEASIENPALKSQIYSSLGNSLNSLKRYKESDEAFEMSLQLDPNNVYALNNYAYYLSLREERLEKAAEMSKRSNELQPGNASFQDTFAWVLFMQKKYHDARVWIEKAIKNNSSSAVQYEHYGDILFNLGEKDQALEQWQKAKEKGVKSETLEKKINEKQFFK